MKLNWNFLGGRGVQNKKPSVGGVWTLLEQHITKGLCYLKTGSLLGGVWIFPGNKTNCLLNQGPGHGTYSISMRGHVGTSGFDVN